MNYTEIVADSVLGNLQFFNNVDHLLFITSDKPWGTSSPVDNSSTLELIEKIKNKYPGKVSILKGSWNIEHEQRNAAIEWGLKKGYHLGVSVDSDAVYEGYSFDNLRKIAISNPEINAFHSHWDTYWKLNPLCKIEPPEPFTPVVAYKLKTFRFTLIGAGSCFVDGKEIDYKGVLLKQDQFFMHHLSYAHTDEFVKKKIYNSSHAFETKSDWYENVWLKWTLDSRDLHPVHTAQYYKAVPVDLDKTHPLIKKRFS